MPLLLGLVTVAAMTLPSVGDPVNIERDPTVSARYAAKWSAWDRIYRDYAAWRGECVALPAEPLRLVAEFRPADKVDFAALRQAGYNGVVLLVDTADEPDVAARWMLAARFAGLKVLVAYAPPLEDHRATVFPDPFRLKTLLRRCGALADGLLLGWRRSSIHMVRQDRAYSAFLIAAARQDQPTLPVIGEIYTGETGDGYAPADAPAIQMPPEATGALVVNYVGPRINPPAATAVLKQICTGRRLMLLPSENRRFIPEWSGVIDYIIIEKQGEK